MIAVAGVGMLIGGAIEIVRLQEAEPRGSRTCGLPAQGIGPRQDLRGLERCAMAGRVLDFRCERF